MRNLAVLLLGVAVIVAQSQDSFARSTKDAGEGSCIAWCYAHNTTDNSQNRCIMNCIDYYVPKGVTLAPSIVEPVGGPGRLSGLIGGSVHIGPATPGLIVKGHPDKVHLQGGALQ